MRKRWLNRNLRELLKYGIVLLVAVGIIYSLISYYGDWPAFSAFATLLIGLAALLSIWENRRTREEDKKSRYIAEIRNWARNAIRLLSKPSQKGINPDERMASIKTNLHTIKVDILTVLADAAVLGNDLEEKIKAATTSFLALDKAVENLDRSVLTDRFMAELLQKFNGIIKSTTRT